MIAIEKNIGSTHISLCYVCFYTPHPRTPILTGVIKKPSVQNPVLLFLSWVWVNPIGHGFKKKDLWQGRCNTTVSRLWRPELWGPSFSNVATLNSHWMNSHNSKNTYTAFRYSINTYQPSHLKIANIYYVLTWILDTSRKVYSS